MTNRIRPTLGTRGSVPSSPTTRQHENQRRVQLQRPVRNGGERKTYGRRRMQRDLLAVKKRAGGFAVDYRLSREHRPALREVEGDAKRRERHEPTRILDFVESEDILQSNAEPSSGGSCACRALGAAAIGPRGFGSLRRPGCQ